MRLSGLSHGSWVWCFSGWRKQDKRGSKSQGSKYFVRCNLQVRDKCSIGSLGRVEMRKTNNLQGNILLEKNAGVDPGAGVYVGESSWMYT